MRFLVTFTLLAAALGCSKDDAPSNACEESASLVYCNGSTNCAFDPDSIDCTVTCMNAGIACSSGSCSLSICSGFDMANCMTGCNATKNQACPNIGWGCHSLETDCDAVQSCIDSH